MQPELYITEDYDAVYNYAKNKSKELQIDFFEFSGNREGIDAFVTLYKQHIKGVVFMRDISKAPIFDALLPILEESDLCIILVSDKRDIKQAIISRCHVTYQNYIYTEEIAAFMNKKSHTMPKEITIGFLHALATYFVEHYQPNFTNTALSQLNDIIRDIQLSTNNILQDELKFRLKNIVGVYE